MLSTSRWDPPGLPDTARPIPLGGRRPVSLRSSSQTPPPHFNEASLPQRGGGRPASRLSPSSILSSRGDAGGPPLIRVTGAAVVVEEHRCRDRASRRVDVIGCRRRSHRAACWPSEQTYSRLFFVARWCGSAGCASQGTTGGEGSVSGGGRRRGCRGTSASAVRPAVVHLTRQCKQPVGRVSGASLPLQKESHVVKALCRHLTLRREVPENGS